MHPGAAYLEQLLARAHALGIDARALKARHGYLPLHIAAEYDNVENIRVLLGTDNLYINEQIHQHQTPLDIAMNQDNEACIALLQSQGAQRYKKLRLDYRTSLLSAIACNDIAKVQSLSTQLHIFNGEKFLWHDPRVGDEALVVAAYWGHLDIVRLLASLAEVDINGIDKHGNTALIRAAEYGHLNIVQYITSLPGIKLNGPNHSNFTALLLAIDAHHLEIAKFLLKLPNTEINKLGPYGDTPLIFAIRRYEFEIAHSLMTLPGINVFTENNERKTALDVAQNIKANLAFLRGDVEQVDKIITRLIRLGASKALIVLEAARSAQ
jgi:ankyrin repeat protein